MNTFIERYMLVSEALRWYKEQKTQRFPIFLQKDAAIRYEQIPDHVKTNFDMLITWIRKEWIPEGTDKLYASMLHTAKMKSNESVHNFATRLISLSKGTYPTWSAKELD